MINGRGFIGPGVKRDLNLSTGLTIGAKDEAIKPPRRSLE
jgi:hypothetical protein